MSIEIKPKKIAFIPRNTKEVGDVIHILCENKIDFHAMTRYKPVFVIHADDFHLVFDDIIALGIPYEDYKE